MMNLDQASTPTTSTHTALDWLEQHGDLLYRVALRRLGRNCSALAEDLVQETLLSALQGHGRFEGRSTQRTWLVGILRNKIADHLRRGPSAESSHSHDVDGYFFDARGRWRVPVPRWDATAADPQALLERSEFWTVLSLCMSKLPTRSADAFWRREAEGVETAELCQQLQVSRANIWAILHRARLQLRHCLTVNWFGPEK
jgi:RNA polymerase sigma-70 factor (ECF subfamily)